MKIFNFYINEDRTVTNDMSGRTVMLADHKVHTINAHIPAEIDGFDMGTWQWWFIYVTAAGQKFSIPLALSSATNDDDETEYLAEFAIEHGVTHTAGDVQYAFEAVNVDGETVVLNEWHSRPYKLAVIKTLSGNHIENTETESDVISTLLTNIAALVDAGTNLNDLAAAVAAAAETAQDVLDSIPQDYSALSDDVESIKDALEEIVQFADGNSDGNIVITLGGLT